MNLIKKNTVISDRHMLGWWQGTDMVIGHWGTGLIDDFGKEAPEGVNLERYYSDPNTVVRREHDRIMAKSFPLDIQSIAIPDINTLPLALYLGAKPTFTSSNIWYDHSDLSPENDYPLCFDKDNRWFRSHMEIYKKMMQISGGRYQVGLPALVPNLDVLAELRGVQDLLMDMILDPGWVHEKLKELNQVFFEVYEEFQPLLIDEKGWTSQGYFMVRGPGKIALTHCDTAAMIGTQMFNDFVVPYLREQCDYLDYSIYHVDGPDAIRSIDPLLEIESLTALEFTPGPQIPPGGDPYWYEMYQKIKKAGKSVQAVWIRPEEVVPLLDAVGPQGMYLMVFIDTLKQAERLEREVESYYS